MHMQEFLKTGLNTYRKIWRESFTFSKCGMICRSTGPTYCQSSVRKILHTICLNNMKSSRLLIAYIVKRCRIRKVSARPTNSSASEKVSDTMCQPWCRHSNISWNASSSTWRPSENISPAFTFSVTSRSSRLLACLRTSANLKRTCSRCLKVSTSWSLSMMKIITISLSNHIKALVTQVRLNPKKSFGELKIPLYSNRD